MIPRLFLRKNEQKLFYSVYKDYQLKMMFYLQKIKIMTFLTGRGVALHSQLV